jgi:D-alanine-D-alanine ligase-like ATP-grasp enzyme
MRVASDRERAPDPGAGAMNYSLTTRAVTALSGAGAVGSSLAVRADQLRDGGMRYARWRREQLSAADKWGPGVRREFYGKLWSDAAAAVGAEVNVLADDFLEFRRDSSRVRTWFHLVELDGALTIRLALDKHVVHQLLKSRGLPVPRHVVFRHRDRDGALRLLDEVDACVVKPSAGTGGGEGVTCGVRSIDDLDRAAMYASRSGDRLLLEEQAAGDEYRLLFLNGELLDVLKRRSPHLVGDGTRTVAELIASENESRAAAKGARGLVALTVDLDCRLTLRRAGLSLGSVPAAGAVVQIKSAANQSGPDDCESVDRSALSDELVAACTTAVCLVGTRFGSVELRTTDPQSPLADGKCAIFDVNGTPGLHYHYLVRNQEQVKPIAELLLEFLLQRSQQRSRRT